MPNDQFPIRQPVRRIEPEDSFPERHINPTAIDLKLEYEITPQFPTNPPPPFSTEVEKPTKHLPSRPPRAPSESPSGYELRGRYWDAAEILELDLEESKKAPDVWDHVYDAVCLPPRGLARTSSMRRLGRMAIRRAWRRRSSQEKPDLRVAHVVEAIMTYERGEVLDAEMRCARCRDGKGASRECVVMPCINGSVCSNCLYDGVTTAACNLPTRRRVVQESVEDLLSVPVTNGKTKPSTEDYMIVLKLIEQMKQASAIGLKKDVSVAAKAKRIEEAALQVAKAAREWGLNGGCS